MLLLCVRFFCIANFILTFINFIMRMCVKLHAWSCHWCKKLVFDSSFFMLKHKTNLLFILLVQAIMHAWLNNTCTLLSLLLECTWMLNACITVP